MSSDKKTYKNSQLEKDETDSEGGSGQSGQGVAFKDFTSSNANINSQLEKDETDSDSGSGQSDQGIAYKDFTSSNANWRDDTLPYDEIKRLISTHQDLNELKVKQQKEKRDQYKSLKEGKLPLQTFREGLAANGARSQYKQNPALANKAQFSGVDRQVNALPTENLAQTNEEQRNELENQLRYRLGYQATPTFNPKPRGPGT